MLNIGDVLFNKYRIINEIGRGGMGVVYLAIDDYVNQTYAVKEVAFDGKDAKMYEFVSDGMRREYKALKKIKHNKVPKIYDFKDYGDSVVKVEDYIPGKNLNSFLGEGLPKQDMEKVVDWIKQTCEVMQFCHDNGILHLDMKPANLMLSPDGKDITVIDFGAAKSIDNLAGSGIVGTYGYCAPEQNEQRNKDLDATTDIYAIGMTMFALLTNIDPHEKQVNLADVHNYDESLPEEIRRIVLKCTKENQSERYRSCSELWFDLNNLDFYADTKKKIARISVIAASLMVSVGCLIGGLVFKGKAEAAATDTYAEMIKNASVTSDYKEKAETYLKAIEVHDMGGEKDAYLGLIQTYKANDGDNPVFSQEEADQIQKLIMNNREALEENEEGYVEICYEIGKLFWYYYYDSNQVTRAKLSIEWFKNVTDRTDSSYSNYGLATVYQSVGTFYRDYMINLNEASDSGMYKNLYNDMSSLVDNVAADSRESEIVRLEMLEMARYAIEVYVAQFRRDGVDKDSLVTLYNRIEEVLDSVQVPEDGNDKLYVRKKETEDRLPGTLDSIELTYDNESV